MFLRDDQESESLESLLIIVTLKLLSLMCWDTKMEKTVRIREYKKIIRYLQKEFALNDGNARHMLECAYRDGLTPAQLWCCSISLMDKLVDLEFAQEFESTLTDEDLAE